MCLGIPALIVELDTESATAQVEIAGTLRRVGLGLLPGLKRGDHVLVHSGIAVERMTPTDARSAARVFAPRAWRDPAAPGGSHG